MKGLQEVKNIINGLFTFIGKQFHSLLYALTTSQRTSVEEVWFRRNNSKSKYRLMFLCIIYVQKGRCIPVCATCIGPLKKCTLFHPQRIHRRRKKKEETLLQWGEQYSAYLVIFLLHTSSRCDNFPTVFTTRTAYYYRLHMNEGRWTTQRQTHTRKKRQRLGGLFCN